ncbi:6216_t:CDS:2 [Dentiscutata heterogama]|uniref:6216_t:CDS:1 n=1 Tax=Dentiscutata heterogama TaxID=1316150 RepID=A0ACA9KC70_9GLOM|nr:6216_t:CDS:2 [Dentiscutata heterogama]
MCRIAKIFEQNPEKYASHNHVILEKDNWLEPLEEPREEPEDLEEEPENLQRELDVGIDGPTNCSDINSVTEPVLVK